MYFREVINVTISISCIVYFAHDLFYFWSQFIVIILSRYFNNNFSYAKQTLSCCFLCLSETIRYWNLNKFYLKNFLIAAPHWLQFLTSDF